MIEAAIWALVGAAGLLFGAIAGTRAQPAAKASPLAVGFGAGLLVAVFGFLLDEKAYELGGGAAAVLGALGGAIAAWLAREWVRRRPGGSGADPIWVLTCLPQSVAIAITLVEDGDIGGAVVAAVFIANVAMALSQGPAVIALWPRLAGVAAVSAAAAFAGLDSAADGVVAVTQAAAIGALLYVAFTGLAGRAGHDQGSGAALAAALGFGLGFAMSIA